MVTKKDKYLAAAQKFLERGSLEKALTEFQRAVGEDAKDTRTWLRIAEIHVKRGENDQATAVYLKTADLYVEQGFFQRAVAVYKNVLKLTPSYIDAHFKLAEIYRHLGLLSDAIQQFEQAANVLQKTGRAKEAITAMRQIVDLNPDQVVARIKLAEACSQAGQVDDAVTEFGLASQQLLAQGRTDEYLRVAERLLFHQPESYALAREMAVKYIERGNARFALAKLQLCFKADPKDTEVLDMLSRAFEQLGQVQKTVQVLKELAKVYAEQGRIPERNLCIQRVLALDPKDAEAMELSDRSSFVGPPPPGFAASLVRPAAEAGSRGFPPSSPGLTRPSQVGSNALTFSEMAVPQFLSPEVSADLGGVRDTAERVALAGAILERTEEEAAAEVERIISESDVFVKYGLVERAVDHLRKVFEFLPTHVGAHERLAAVLLQLGRTAEAVVELETLAEQLLAGSPDEAATYAKRALEIDASARRAVKVLETIAAKDSVPALDEAPIAMPSDPRMPTLVGVEGFDDESPLLEIGESMGEELVFVDVEPEELAIDDLIEEPESAVAVAPVEAPPDESMLADLEQVDFFLEQAIADEAQTLLDELSSRHGPHSLIQQRLMRLASLENATDGVVSSPVEHGAVPATPIGGSTPPVHEPAVRSMVEDEITEPTVVDAASAGAEGVSPRAVVAGGGQVDLTTHADLGIAYKEMGLFDAAIKEFLILAQDSKREVFALTMIGECHEAKGAPPEAVVHYKKALNRPQIANAEATQLYYQLGTVFQTLGDKREALYFFEKVAKRDPQYRDVARNVSALRSLVTGVAL